MKELRRALIARAVAGDVQAVQALWQAGEKIHLPPSAWRHIVKLRKEAPRLAVKAQAVLDWMEVREKTVNK